MTIFPIIIMFNVSPYVAHLHSSPTRVSHSHISGQIHRMLSPKTFACGVFDRGFAVDSHEWSCSHNGLSGIASVRLTHNRAGLSTDAFERLLGPCTGIMMRSIHGYEDRLRELFGQ